MEKIVTSAEALTPEWFTSALGKPVTAVDVEPFGTGLIARMARAELTYEDGDAGPDSVVVKYPTDDEGSLGLALAMGMYELETRFYQDIAPLLTEMNIPECHLAAYDEESGMFTLMLEDLSGRARPGDVLAGASVEECSLALGELVRFQAPLWNSKEMSDLAWLADPSRTIGVFDSLPAGLEPFVARFGASLEPEHVQLFESVLPRSGEWVRSWKAPTVVQHGDFRTDNILLGEGADAPPLTVIDFQTVRLGPPGLDPAYFLGASLSTEDRRASERDLVTKYHEGLLAAGVEDFGFDACWEAYREGAMYGVYLFVGMASQVESTERGDKLIVEQIKRYADMALDLEAPAAAGLT